MSGGIILDDEACWIVAGWAAEAAAEALCRELDETARVTVANRLSAIGLYPGSLADFSQAPADEVLALYKAATKAKLADTERGPDGWVEPSFFPGYLARLQDLIDLLAKDRRIADRGAG